MTVSSALEVSNRSVSFRDAEILLGAAIDRERSWLLAHPEAELSLAEAERYESFLTRREANEPVAYILGRKEFYGRPFIVDRRVLIPRPETEGLIDRALALLSRYRESLRILELGTGCGNIAITLALELEKREIQAEIIATDLSADALDVASINWKQLGGTSHNHLHLLPADLFAEPHIRKHAPYQLIAANLPYVPTAWKSDPAAQPEVVFQEPDLALFGGEDGLALYRRFFAEAPAYLATGGTVLVEFGDDETAAIHALAQAAFPQHTVTIHQDYSGLDRVLEISPPRQEKG